MKKKENNKTYDQQVASNLLETLKEETTKALKSLLLLEYEKKSFIRNTTNGYICYCSDCENFNIISKNEGNLYTNYNANAEYSRRYTITCPTCGHRWQTGYISSGITFKAGGLKCKDSKSNALVFVLQDVNSFPSFDRCDELSLSELTVKEYLDVREYLKVLNSYWKKYYEDVTDYYNLYNALIESNDISFDDYENIRYELDVTYAPAMILLYLLIREHKGILDMNKETFGARGFLLKSLSEICNIPTDKPTEKKASSVIPKFVRLLNKEGTGFILPDEVLKYCNNLDEADAWRKFFKKNKITDTKEMLSEMKKVTKGSVANINKHNKVKEMGFMDSDTFYENIYRYCLLSGTEPDKASKAAINYMNKCKLKNNEFVAGSFTPSFEYLLYVSESNDYDIKYRMGNTYETMIKEGIKDAEETVFLENGDMCVLVDDLLNLATYCSKTNISLQVLRGMYSNNIAYMYTSQDSPNKVYVLNRFNKILLEKEYA